MAGEWRVRKIGTFAKAKGGKRLPKSIALQTEKNNHPYIRVVDFTDGKIHQDSLLYVPNDAISAIQRYRVAANDVIISIVGTIGAIAQVPQELHGANLTENAAKLYFTEEDVDASYVAYYLKSSLGQHEITINTVGSTQPKLPLYGIENINVALPPLKEQQAIGCILGTLDDKIELNRRMNKTLEEMARAIFKSWFVDFDPVHAKAAVRSAHPGWTNEQVSRSACPNLKPEIAALFPDSFEDSELGEIPKGWKVGHVGDLAYVSSGKRPEARYTDPSPESSVPLWGGNGPMGFVPEPLTTEPILLTGRVGTLGSVFRISTPCWPSDNTLIIRAKRPHTFEYLFIQLQKIDYTSLNRGSTQPLLTQTDLQSQWVILPAFEVLEHFSRFTCSIYGRIDADERESRTLAALRDTLLPKLISGELRVPDAERIVGRCI